jgi:hypothetical protein
VTHCVCMYLGLIRKMGGEGVSDGEKGGSGSLWGGPEHEVRVNFSGSWDPDRSRLVTVCGATQVCQEE